MYGKIPFKYTRTERVPVKVYGKRIDGKDVNYPWELLDIKPDFESYRGEEVEMEESKIDESGGPVHLGDNVKVRGSEIRGPAWIGRNCKIGPGALIRTGSIGENCKIGHSVEVKNSIFQRDTKVPHLSYVGDSVVGSQVNFAAGTKTANLRHDEAGIEVKMGRKEVDTGRRKLGAIVGDCVKTGIDTKLYQGVVVGPYSFTHPGAEAVESLKPFRILRGRENRKAGKEMMKSAFPGRKEQIDELWGKICAE
ncbi:MAG: hypothetical protein ACLFTQ_02140 [Candidatus Aenigmatarchaeota archaeon]